MRQNFPPGTARQTLKNISLFHLRVNPVFVIFLNCDPSQRYTPPFVGISSQIKGFHQCRFQPPDYVMSARRLAGRRIANRGGKPGLCANGSPPAAPLAPAHRRFGWIASTHDVDPTRNETVAVSTVECCRHRDSHARVDSRKSLHFATSLRRATFASWSTSTYKGAVKTLGP